MNSPNGTEERLRPALAAEVADVDVPAHALDEIRRRVARRRRPLRLAWGRWGGPALLGSVATATAAAVFGLATCAPPDREVQPPGGSSPAVAPPTVQDPQPTDPGVPDLSTAPSAAGRPVTVPVYYVGRSRRGPVLYREFRPATAGTVAGGASAADLTRAAVTAMLTPGSAADPDYATHWPAAGRVRDVRVAGPTVTVDLAGVADAGPGDPALAARSIDQLVYTATAASDTDALRLLVDGRPATRLWGVPITDPLVRRPAVDVQAPLWLIGPAHGDTVGRTVAVHVAGIVPEATAQLRVRDPGGRVVTERTLTLSTAGPQVGEVRLSVQLAPGRYTVEVYAVSADDGSEQHHDDHDVTVR